MRQRDIRINGRDLMKFDYSLTMKIHVLTLAIKPKAAKKHKVNTRCRSCSPDCSSCENCYIKQVGSYHQYALDQFLGESGIFDIAHLMSFCSGIDIPDDI